MSAHQGKREMVVWMKGAEGGKRERIGLARVKFKQRPLLVVIRALGRCMTSQTDAPLQSPRPRPEDTPPPLPLPTGTSCTTTAKAMKQTEWSRKDAYTAAPGIAFAAQRRSVSAPSAPARARAACCQRAQLPPSGGSASARARGCDRRIRRWGKSFCLRGKATRCGDGRAARYDFKPASCGLMAWHRSWRRGCSRRMQRRLKQRWVLL